MEIRNRRNMWTLSLVVCTLTYLLIGAAVFDYFESEAEAERWEFLNDMRNKMVKHFNITAEDYLLLETIVIENKPNKSGPQWKFAGSFYFAIVVVTMIGYGYSTPVTLRGRAFCMLYAIIGVPLGLVMYQCIGERLNKFNAIVIRRIKTTLNFKKVEANGVNLTIIAGLYSSIVITLGALYFTKNEGWSFLDSIYYCFVTFTTVGFGDFVALQNDRALTSKPGYVVFTLMFILFGLSVVAACFNLLVVNVMTFNAVDTQRDESENGPLQKAVSIDGDISISANITLINDQIAGSTISDDSDQLSTCSCGCISRYSSNKVVNNHLVLPPVTITDVPDITELDRFWLSQI